MWHIYIYEKEMAINSNILAWKILWTEEATGYSPWGHKETAMTLSDPKDSSPPGSSVHKIL